MAHTDWLSGRANGVERRRWAGWLDLLPAMRDDFQRAFDDDPLFYNETASVGLIASAASRTGLLALSEYAATKRGTTRGRPHQHGRCDLWIGCPATHESWAFEFKQRFAANRVRSASLENWLAQACKDARAVHPLEANRRYGALLVSAYAGETLSGASIEAIMELARRSTLARQINGGSGLTYLLVQRVR